MASEDTAVVISHGYVRRLVYHYEGLNDQAMSPQRHTFPHLLSMS